MRRFAWVFVLFACGSQPDDPSTTPDAPSQTAPRCGDGVCEGSEVGACPSDCGAAGPCGDGTCGANESAATCPADCSGQTCGDGNCTPPETEATCPGDCGGGGGSAVCGNLACETGEDALTCPTDCGGGGGSTCPGDPVECVFCWVDPTTCIPPQSEAVCEECLGLGGDPGPCNVDLVCDPGEDPTNCPSDCP